MSITLYKKGESTGSTFTQSEPNLVGAGREFTIANVTAGTWILYTDINYNKEGNKEGKNQTFKIVHGDQKGVKIDSVNGSMFLVDEGLILFEHFGYGGDRKWFQDNQEDLTGLFPDPPKQSPKKSGVSSAILLSKNRSVELFTETYFGEKGDKYTLQPGEWCEMLKFSDKHQPGHNDKWLSLKFIYKA